MKDRGLYIHIPFCEAKCAYCDFYSLAGNEKSLIQSDYIDALCKSASLMSEKFSDTLFSSVYIGGGTPSVLSPELLARLLSALQESFNIEKSAEFTIEANEALVKQVWINLNRLFYCRCCSLVRVYILWV